MCNPLHSVEHALAGPALPLKLSYSPCRSHSLKHPIANNECHNSKSCSESIPVEVTHLTGTQPIFFLNMV